MESALQQEELFSNEDEILNFEEGQMQLTNGNDEHFPVKQEGDVEPFLAFNAHDFLSKEYLKNEDIEDDGVRVGQSFCNQKGSEFDDGAAEEQRDNGEKKCPVDRCNQSASSSEDLIKHMKEHSAPWLCGVCKKFWPCASQLRLHFMTHTGEKPFKCDICEKRFSLSSNLKSHMRIHTGNSYNCSLCGYKTNFYDLKIHKRRHLGEKLNTCPICGKNFSCSKAVAAHMHIHSEEKPHPCTICDKHFRRSSDLVSHMRTHSGDKPYACDKCEFKAFFSCHLKRHNRTHTISRSPARVDTRQRLRGI